MSVAGGWTELDVDALGHIIRHGRCGGQLSHRLLDDLRRVVDVDEVLLLERDTLTTRVTVAAPQHAAVGAASREHAVWAAVWQSERCGEDGATVLSEACLAEHLHHTKVSPDVHEGLAASCIVLAPLAAQHKNARLAFVRRGRAFDERDRIALALVRSHLASAYRRSIEPRTGSSALTPRQRAILHLVARGCSNDEIAARLVVASGTVRKHLDNVFRQLGVSSRAAAVARAFPDGVPPHALIDGFIPQPRKAASAYAARS